MEQKTRRPYEAPTAKFAKLEPEERLLACLKLKGLCGAMNDGKS